MIKTEYCAFTGKCIQQSEHSVPETIYTILESEPTLELAISMANSIFEESDFEIIQVDNNRVVGVFDSNGSVVEASAEYLDMMTLNYLSECSWEGEVQLDVIATLVQRDGIWAPLEKHLEESGFDWNKQYIVNQIIAEGKQSIVNFVDVPDFNNTVLFNYTVLGQPYDVHSNWLGLKQIKIGKGAKKKWK